MYIHCCCCCCCCCCCGCAVEFLSNPFKTHMCHTWGENTLPLVSAVSSLAVGLISSQVCLGKGSLGCFLGMLATYLEDHPRTCKWLGSPPFKSHEWPVGKWTTLLRGLINLPHGMILQVHTQKTDMGSIHVQKDVWFLTEEVPLSTCQTA